VQRAAWSALALARARALLGKRPVMVGEGGTWLGFSERGWVAGQERPLPLGPVDGTIWRQSRSVGGGLMGWGMGQ
jgi:hypothetical protein